MILSGVVTNVTAFGAFVDIGVHQDGLVHISEMADRFVQDPAEVVKVHQAVTVRVLGVDLSRKRIALRMKKDPLSEKKDRLPERSDRKNKSSAQVPRKKRGSKPPPEKREFGDVLGIKKDILRQ